MSGRLESQRGVFNFGALKEDIYPVLIGYFEDLRNARKKGTKDALNILYKMLCMRVFMKSMITMMKLMVANFIRANEDVQIAGRALSSTLAAAGSSIEAFITEKLMVSKQSPPEIVLSILPAVLRMSVEIVLVQYQPIVYMKPTLYSSELPGYKLFLNDSLNFHDARISLSTQGEDKYDILYNVAKLPREIETTAIATEAFMLPVLKVTMIARKTRRGPSGRAGTRKQRENHQKPEQVQTQTQTQTQTQPTIRELMPYKGEA